MGFLEVDGSLGTHTEMGGLGNDGARLNRADQHKKDNNGSTLRCFSAPRSCCRGLCTLMSTHSPNTTSCAHRGHSSIFRILASVFLSCRFPDAPIPMHVLKAPKQRIECVPPFPLLCCPFRAALMHLHMTGQGMCVGVASIHLARLMSCSSGMQALLPTPAQCHEKNRASANIRVTRTRCMRVVDPEM